MLSTTPQDLPILSPLAQVSDCGRAAGTGVPGEHGATQHGHRLTPKHDSPEAAGGHSCLSNQLAWAVASRLKRELRRPLLSVPRAHALWCWPRSCCRQADSFLHLHPTTASFHTSVSLRWGGQSLCKSQLVVFPNSAYDASRMARETFLEFYSLRRSPTPGLR